MLKMVVVGLLLFVESCYFSFPNPRLTLNLLNFLNGLKKSSRTSVRDIIFPILKDIFQFIQCFGLFLIGWSCLNTIWSDWFLNLSFDVLSVICMFYNLGSPFKISFYLVLSIVFSFRTHAFFYLGAIRRLSRNGTCVTLTLQ